MPVLAGKKNADDEPFTTASKVPELRVAGQEQRGGRRLARAADEVRNDHHAVAWEAVRQHAAEEQEQDDRALPCRQDDPDVRRRPVQRVQYGERKCDRRHRAPGHRDRAPGEEEPELALPQRA
jgi:hypothetical protein